MLHNSLKKLWILAFGSVLCLQGLAVPAQPGPMKFKNGDHEITVYLHGDENFHYYTTADGYLLEYRDDKFSYAAISEDNVLSTVIDGTSEILASDPEYRETSTQTLLEGIDLQRQNKALKDIADLRLNKRVASFSSTRALPSAQVGLFPGCHFPAKGAQKALVILVEYQDVPFTLEDPLDYFSRMLNEPGFCDYDGTGSARDYFIENSSGQFTPEFDVVGPVKLDNDRRYYGGNSTLTGEDLNAHGMVVEACEKIDSYTDFSQYDRDGDGFIDNVFIFFAGRGEASGGPAESIWPHSWNITKAYSEPIMLDGVRLDYYACTNEWTRNRPDGIGTFVHEFSHVMGLPDLYSTNGGTSAFTPGGWSVMDYGPYNNNGCTPPMYSTFERYALGWLSPIVIDKDQNATLPPISDNVAGIIPTNFPNEFFLVENRQQTSWDTFIPGHGMLVWHVDYVASVWDRNTVNNNASHQYVDLMEADGLPSDGTRDGDAFPGTEGVTSFTEETEPAMVTWAGKGLGFPFTNITEIEGEISFTVGKGREPIESPLAFDPQEVTATSATVSWSKTNAAAYRLDLYRKDEDGTIIGLKKFYLGDTDTMILTDLTPETFYYYTVRGCEDLEMSVPSEEIEFYTGHLTIDYFTVETLEIEEDDILEDGFSVSWIPLDDAVSYFFNLYTKEPGNPYEAICNFSEMPELSDGWKTDATLTYGMSVWAGEEVPSLRMNGVKTIESPLFDDCVKSISFWHRGSSTSNDDRIIVKGFVSDEWVELGIYSVATEKGGKTILIEDIKEDVNAVKIIFDPKSSGNLALDDINIRWGARLVDTPVVEFFDKEVGNVTEYTVRPLTSGTYYFTVTATDGTQKSKPSAERSVIVGNPSGLSSINEEICCWSIDGSVLTVKTEENKRFLLADLTGQVIKTGYGPSKTVLPHRGIFILSIDGCRPVKIINTAL